MKKVKVLIIEDSKSMQEILANILADDPEIEIVGQALDPYMARELIKVVNPDVLTLDILMPRMDGITFLKNLMRLHPLPVVMVSALTTYGSAIALEALALGAIDYIPKPNQSPYDIDSFSKHLIQSIKNASTVNVSIKKTPNRTEKKLASILYHSDFLKNILIVMGGSTGGIEAFESILLQIPKIFPAIVITQHIRSEFSAAFVTRINKLSNLMIKEATDNEEIVPGTIFIAPGGTHLLVQQVDDKLYCKLNDGPPINGHKPSVDCLFQSVAKITNKKIKGVLLTGMGTDGAQGAKLIHNAGGIMIAQDKQSSVVFGMPKAAIELNAIDYILSLNEIPQFLFQKLDQLSCISRTHDNP